MRVFCALLLVIGAGLRAERYAIFFDLGGVLLEWDRAAQVQTLAEKGLSVTDYPALLAESMQLLEDVGGGCGPDGKGLQKPEPGSAPARWVGGVVAPRNVCLWFAGKMSGQELVEATDAYINNFKKVAFFESLEAYNKCFARLKLLRDVIYCNYDPVFNMRFIRTIPTGVALLQECIASVGANRVYMLSNWSRDQLALLEQSPRVTPVFDVIPRKNRVISGLVGTVDSEGIIHNIKPYRSIFEYVFKTYNLRPEQCIFIDDQEENLQPARACGMHAIHLVNRDFGAVRAELERLGVFEHQVQKVANIVPVMQGV
jgi:FMN phosphatase YigB (HAD superfamily)